jgi:hypothetical protein
LDAVFLSPFLNTGTMCACNQSLGSLPCSKDLSSLRDNQGYLHSEAKDKAEILNAQFKSVYTQEDHTNIPHKGPSPYSAMQNITITGNGVYKLLRNIKPHKATGPDNIQARYLKELALELTPAITFLFQTSLEQGKLPNDWLQAHIVPVFKKGDKNTASQNTVMVPYVVCLYGLPVYTQI